MSIPDVTSAAIIALAREGYAIGVSRLHPEVPDDPAFRIVTVDHPGFPSPLHYRFSGVDVESNRLDAPAIVRRVRSFLGPAQLPAVQRVDQTGEAPA